MPFNNTISLAMFFHWHPCTSKPVDLIDTRFGAITGHDHHILSLRRPRVMRPIICQLVEELSVLICSCSGSSIRWGMLENGINSGRISKGLRRIEREPFSADA